jgi:hypothetical protein
MDGESRDLARILEGLVSVLVGTRDGANRPECLIAAGLVVEPGGRRVTVFLPEATSAKTIENLRDNAAIAVCMDRPTTHRAVQMKGRCAGIRPAGPEDRPAMEAAAAAFFAEVEAIGVPPRAIRRLAAWPCLVVSVDVEDVFVQTPGPGAGEPYRGRA